MRSLALAALMALTAGPAAALSCVVYDIRAAFWQHQDRPEVFILAHGSFGPLDQRRYDKTNDTVIWRAIFTGHQAGSRAFDQPFSVKVTINNRLFTGIAGGETDPDALASWLPGQTGLVFLRQAEGGLALDIALCEPAIDTDPANVRRALDCLNRRRCPRPS